MVVNEAKLVSVLTYDNAITALYIKQIGKVFAGKLLVDLCASKLTGTSHRHDPTSSLGLGSSAAAPSSP
jgi:hypothetical protein